MVYNIRLWMNVKHDKYLKYIAAIFKPAADSVQMSQDRRQVITTDYSIHIYGEWMHSLNVSRIHPGVIL